MAVPTGLTRVIIVGQGLAGTILAWQLHRRNIPFVIIDEAPDWNASKVAAGLMDPISGQRYFQAWNADRVLPVAVAFYRELETRLGASFFHMKPSIRFFSSQADRELWESKRFLPRVSSYFPNPAGTYFDATIQAPFGGVEVVGSAYLDTQTFLRLSRDYFRGLGQVISERLVYSALTLFSEGVHYRDLQANQLIFCEGHQASQNPWFGYLPYNHSKGNILLATATDFPSSHILHLGKWILPLPGQQLKIGATYDRAFTDSGPDRFQQAVLLSDLAPWLKTTLTPTGLLAGIRPIALDNKPILGLHPAYPQLGIFNALASRGVSLGPFYAAQLVSHVMDHQPLDREIDLNRYSRYYVPAL